MVEGMGFSDERGRRWPYPQEIYAKHFRNALSTMGLLMDLDDL